MQRPMDAPQTRRRSPQPPSLVPACPPFTPPIAAEKLSDIFAARGVSSRGTIGLHSRHRPAASDPNAYCLRVDGDGLAPAARADDLLIVSPAMTLRACGWRPGGLVVVWFHSGPPAVWRLVSPISLPLPCVPSDATELLHLETADWSGSLRLRTNTVCAIHAVRSIAPVGTFTAHCAPVAGACCRAVAS